jgi:microsomal dipeptidase-like Zn-dependent dipeptidase
MVIFKRRLLLALILFVLLFFSAPLLLQLAFNRVTGDSDIPESEAAAVLHDHLFIADLHSDALLWNRNLNQRSKLGHTDFVRLVEGNVALQAFTVVTRTPVLPGYHRNSGNYDGIMLLAIAQRWPLTSWKSIRERALYQSRKLHRFTEQSGGRFTLIRSGKHLTEYLVRRTKEANLTAGFLGLEGAQALEGDIKNLHVLFEAGFRMMALSHFSDTRAAGSAHGDKKYGLTSFGRQVIAVMDSLGMIIDLAHASENTIDDILAATERPVLVSHTGVRAICDSNRNLSDKHLIEIAAGGGLIGVGFFSAATCGDNVDAIVRSIRYAVELVGFRHVALGSDFDGLVAVPFDASGMSQLTAALLSAGFSKTEIAAIMGENVKKFLLNTLPAG